jgi:hypothetical protein
MALQVERCLRQAAAPLLDMLRRWLFEGRLAAAPGDFFVIASPFPKGRRACPLSRDADCMHTLHGQP